MSQESVAKSSDETEANCLNEFPEGLFEQCPEQFATTEEALEFLKRVVENRGPNLHEHDALSWCFISLWRDRVPFEQMRAVMQPVISNASCIQGFGFLKPHGYAGDFEIIDRIYTYWKTDNPELRRFDEYFHAQPAPRAVRNRKTYLQKLLRRKVQSNSFHVLNIGSGPARDISECLPLCPSVRFDCIDMDENANDYGRSLCAGYPDQVVFQCQNVLRLRPQRSYDLIWSAGLFDYFSDRIFVATLRRLVRHIRAGGELVIGNFSKLNPSRYWMEAVGDWKLYHRTRAELIALAARAGIPADHVHVGAEPENINLFLHING